MWLWTPTSASCLWRRTWATACLSSTCRAILTRFGGRALPVALGRSRLVETGREGTCMSTRAGDALTGTTRRGEQVLQHMCQLKGGWHMAWLGCPVASRAQSGAVWTVDAAARARYACGLPELCGGAPTAPALPCAVIRRRGARAAPTTASSTTPKASAWMEREECEPFVEWEGCCLGCMVCPCGQHPRAAACHCLTDVCLRCGCELRCRAPASRCASQHATPPPGPVVRPH